MEESNLHRGIPEIVNHQPKPQKTTSSFDDFRHSETCGSSSQTFPPRPLAMYDFLVESMAAPVQREISSVAGQV